VRYFLKRVNFLTRFNLLTH